MTIFEKNIKALSKQNPLLASSIFGKKQNDFEIFIHNNDNASINYIDKKNSLPLYETTPLEEITKEYTIFENKYNRYPVLFFFGIGNGVLIKMLLDNPFRKKIVIIEPNEEILYLTLNLIDFSKEIEENRLIILSIPQATYPQIQSIVSNPDIILFLKTYNLFINTPYYEKLYKKEILHINKIFTRAIKQAITNFGNDTKDTLIGIEHSILNIPLMVTNPPLKEIENKKNSETAIIVSTGPSLTKQLPLLKEIQQYATIIAVDASMPILSKWDIVPDFVTSLERVKETGKFFKLTPKEFQQKTIKVHASLQHKEVLNNSHGPKIISMRSFLYNKYLELDDFGYLGIGMSAANMAYELAYKLGLKKIILIGQDLAYSEDGKSHAKDHVYGEDEVKYKPDDIFVTKYGGKGTIRTSKIWMMFKNFFEKDIELLNQEGVVTINATEGGARIEGTIEKPFKEVIKEIPTIKKTPIVISTPFNNSQINELLKKAYEKIIKMEKKGKEVQKKVEDTFLKVAKEFDNLVYLNQTKQLEKIDFNYLIDLSKEIDKIKELIEEKEFFQMYGETISSYLINKETDLAKIQVQNPTTDIEKKAKLIDWIMNHKDWLFMLAGSINAQRIVIQRALPNLKKELKKRELI